AREECVALTEAMTRSGTTLRWDGLPGPVLDKHSTGGVGDKVSLILAPIIAACGGFVPMISGRGLGHTGGTLDKMAAIPGYRTDPDLDTFRRVVREVGCAIVGQTDDLAPADRRLYAIRDVTATVESIPLITASILSKKLAEGLSALVMDVKVGSGAFADSDATARALAESIVAVAGGAGLPTTALITDMDQVLGTTVGNALEVIEAIDFLKGFAAADHRLRDLVMALAAEILVLGQLATSRADALQKVDASLTFGSAASAFDRMVRMLGGPPDFVQFGRKLLPRAPVIRPCPPPAAGRILSMDVRAIGLAVVELGGGRRRASDAVNPAVGLTDVRPRYAWVDESIPVAVVHAATDDAADAAIATIQRAVRIGERVTSVRPTLRGRVDLSGQFMPSKDGRIE
ncbi:MAG TPA: thymidine phosphorylase, partial [Vineibacter sp.]|nr:thymidine phosphorylase [Vineibacter sp.]